MGDRFIIMKEIYIVDRKENEKFILEDNSGKITNIDSKLVFGNIKDGDVLVKISNNYYLDEEETLKRKEAINNLTQGMWVNE